MKKLFTATLASATFLLFSLPVMADGHSGDESDASVKEHQHKPGHHGKGMRKRHEMMMKRVDTNEDGKIDLNEYMAHAEARFQKLDLNKDGYVTPAEQREAGKAMREKHREMREQRRATREAAKAESSSGDDTE